MENNERERVDIRTVSLYPTEWAIIEAYAKDMGYPGVSSALRRVIREWAQFKQTQLPLPQPQMVNQL